MEEDIEAIEDIFCGVVFMFIVAALFWAILSIPAGAQTIQADSTFGALSHENSLRDSSQAVETIKAWDVPKWENEIITVPHMGNIVFYQDATSPLALIRGDSLFIDDSTFVLLQRLNKSKFGWITDSIKWVLIDTTFAGGQHCQHDWVFSEVQRATLRVGDAIYMKIYHVLACAAGYHPKNSEPFIKPNYPSHESEEHCPYEVMNREKICRKCMRGEIEREKWFQHFVAPPKSEFERLKEKQTEKQ